MKRWLSEYNCLSTKPYVGFFDAGIIDMKAIQICITGSGNGWVFGSVIDGAVVVLGSNSLTFSNSTRALTSWNLAVRITDPCSYSVGIGLVCYAFLINDS